MDVDVTSRCSIMCAVNSQHVKDVFKHIWTLSVALDAGNNAGIPYNVFQISDACCFQDNIQNFHYLALPICKPHNEEYPSVHLKK